MNLTTLRLSLATLWIGFWILSSFAVILAPHLRGDQAVGSEQVIGVLIQISVIWLPPLSCFGAFWFPKSERRRSNPLRATRETVIGAMAVTTGYMVIVCWLLASLLYFERFSVVDDKGNPQPGNLLSARVSEIVKYSLLISPLALAPVGYLTGRARNGG
jgi:hypothetical protein